MKLIYNAAKFIAALLLITIFSCENDQEVTVGGEVLPGSAIKFKEIVLDDVVNLEQVSTERVQSNNLPYYRLGKNAKALYELVLKPRKGSNLPLEKVGNQKNDTMYRFNSAKLVLSYRFDQTAQVDESTVSFKIRENASQKSEGLNVKVFLLDQTILNLNPEKEGENVYYADGWQPQESNIIDLEKEKVELDSDKVSSPAKDILNVTVNGNPGVSNTLLRLSKNIEKVDPGAAFNIDLKAPQFEEYYGKASLSAEELNVKSGSAFQDFFKAFYIKPNDDADDVFELLPAESNVISRVEVVFDLVDEKGNPFKEEGVDEQKQQYVFFYLNNQNITLDPSLNAEGDRAQSINLIKSSKGDEMPSENSVMLSNGVGSIAKLKLFPDLKTEDPSNTKSLLTMLYEEGFVEDGFSLNSIISEAVLRFTAKTTVDLPDRLVLNRFNESGFLKDFSDALNTEGGLSKNHLIKKQEIDGEMVYDIVITEHLQRILNQKTLEEAQSQNFDLSLGIYNEEEGARLISASQVAEGDDKGRDFYIFENSLYSSDEVSIYSSNDMAGKSLKPKLIVKFTPTN